MAKEHQVYLKTLVILYYVDKDWVGIIIHDEDDRRFVDVDFIIIQKMFIGVERDLGDMKDNATLIHIIVSRIIIQIIEKDQVVLAN